LIVTGWAELPFCPWPPLTASCSPELLFERVSVTSFEGAVDVADVDEALFPSLRLMTSSGVVDVAEFALDAAPRFIRISDTPLPEDDPFAWSRLRTSSGVFDLLAELLPDAPPKLITISGAPLFPDDPFA
jgi:hypothetical protein